MSNPEKVAFFLMHDSLPDAKPKREPILKFSFRSVQTKLLSNTVIYRTNDLFARLTVVPVRALGDVPAPSFHYSQPYDTQVCYNGKKR